MMKNKMIPRIKKEFSRGKSSKEINGRYK